ncbi:cysteine protease ATG4-like [Olea europaea var. sylvestris]|uniref:cysteine protease ATG4-like n=1 Tax=Olea europaea var. sylvestris TaxID=158386 RepID=UPI000C1D627C|nr:cysteine protease ATG4-like [Olea europaea var. sylvestris]
MKGFQGKNSDPIRNSVKKNCNYSLNGIQGSVSSEAGPSACISKDKKSVAIWSGIWLPALSIFGTSNSNNNSEQKSSCNTSTRKKSLSGRNYYEDWRAAVRRVMMNGGSMRRILGFNKSTGSLSNSDIWLLGICYKIAQQGDDLNSSSSDPTQKEGFTAFVEDYSSLILITYRKGFDPIRDSKYTSDVHWGCMLRSSQMLVAQAFLFHKFGRSWRKSIHKLLDQSYIDVLQLFGDSEDSPFSIHNLLQAGKAYGLAPGSWVGPYAMCRTWETLVRSKREENKNGGLPSMMTIYVVSGDEDGEHGGAPVLCFQDISRHCFEFSRGEVDWTPVLMLVPLVLGLDKVNPRYLPLLAATFTFPQCLGILGGRPGASTYIVGVQDGKAFYLDPHEVQQVVDIKRDSIEADTSSYHCNAVRHIPLDLIDPSLAIGFYCRDKSDFDDFCARALELFNQSNGAPLFTIAKTCSSPNPAAHHETLSGNAARKYDSIDLLPTDEPEDGAQDDWQLI